MGRGAAGRRGCDSLAFTTKQIIANQRGLIAGVNPTAARRAILACIWNFTGARDATHKQPGLYHRGEATAGSPGYLAPSISAGACGIAPLAPSRTC